MLLTPPQNPAKSQFNKPKTKHTNCSSACNHVQHKAASDSPTPSNSNKIWDKLGMFSSILCGIHCLITPLILGIFFTLQSQNVFLESWESIDKICLFLAPLFAYFSLRHGLKEHGSIWPSGVFSGGLVLLILGIYVFDHDHGSAHSMIHSTTMLVGGICIASSHLLNLKLSKQTA